PRRLRRLALRVINITLNPWNSERDRDPPVRTPAEPPASSGFPSEAVLACSKVGEAQDRFGAALQQKGSYALFALRTRTSVGRAAAHCGDDAIVDPAVAAQSRRRYRYRPH